MEMSRISVYFFLDLILHHEEYCTNLMCHIKKLGISRCSKGQGLVRFSGDQNIEISLQTRAFEHDSDKSTIIVTLVSVLMAQNDRGKNSDKI